MNKSIKSLGFIAALGVATSFSFAQTAPEGYTVIDGDLYLNGNLVAEQPDGTVDGSGALTIGSTTIPAPTATVLPNGDLDLGGGVVLSVPSLGTGLEVLFGSSITAAVGAPDWYFHDNFKYINFTSSSDFVYFQELDAFLYIYTDNPDATASGFIAWTDGLDGVNEASSSVSLSGSGAFIWLGAGFETVTKTDVMDGYFWMFDSNDGRGAGWFYFSEYDNGGIPGNWAIRITANGSVVSDGEWVKLSDSVE